MIREQASERINNIFSNGTRLSGFYKFLINNPHISFWNGVQIYTERPNATICKSFDDWHDQDNRRIKRGERGIAYYDENKPNRKVYVFDISQTYGSERYHSVQHKMSQSQLRDSINRQNIFTEYREKMKPRCNLLYTVIVKSILQVEIQKNIQRSIWLV